MLFRPSSCPRQSELDFTLTSLAGLRPRSFRGEAEREADASADFHAVANAIPLRIARDPELIECRQEPAVEAKERPPKWKTLLAFAIIYLVWGSTFLAIRVGVREVPPFLLAAMRFLLAGMILYVWMLAKGAASPSRREWVSASLLAVLIFVFDYGLLFWAEQRVPSGVAAVMMATTPVFMVLSEILFLGTQRLTVRLVLALLIGIGGVAVLVSRSLNFGEVPIETSGVIALVAAAIRGWVSSALTERLPLPPSKAMSSAAQMLSGGVLLTLAAGVLGEF